MSTKITALLNVYGDDSVKVYSVRDEHGDLPTAAHASYIEKQRLDAFREQSHYPYCVVYTLDSQGRFLVVNRTWTRQLLDTLSGRCVMPVCFLPAEWVGRYVSRTES